MLQQVFRWAIKTFELEIFSTPRRAWSCPARPIYRREVMTAKENDVHVREAVGEPWEANIILAVALGLRPSEALGVTGRTSTGAAAGCTSARVPHAAKRRDGGVPLQDAPVRPLPQAPALGARATAPRTRGQRRRGRVRGDLTPRQVYTQYKRFLKSIGLGRCSHRGAGHSWATLAIASGAAIADVSVAMGHTTTRMVIEHYMMSTRAVSKRATDAAGRAIEEGLEAYAMAA